MTTAAITESAQYLTFRLGGEVFALDIAQVREVLDYTTVTRVPRMPAFMRGVINLRGSVVPVVDLGGERTVIGALADSVQEVIELEPAQIEAPPRIGPAVRADFIRGMGRSGAGFIIILDVDRVFSTEELALVAGTVAEPAPEAGEGGRRDG